MISSFEGERGRALRFPSFGYSTGPRGGDALRRRLEAQLCGMDETLTSPVVSLTASGVVSGRKVCRLESGV